MQIKTELVKRGCAMQVIRRPRLTHTQTSIQRDKLPGMCTAQTNFTHFPFDPTLHSTSMCMSNSSLSSIKGLDYRKEVLQMFSWISCLVTSKFLKHSHQIVSRAVLLLCTSESEHLLVFNGNMIMEQCTGTLSLYLQSFLHIPTCQHIHWCLKLLLKYRGGKKNRKCK